MARVAVLGLSQFGFHLVEQLHAEGHELLVVDRRLEKIQQVRERASRAVVLDVREKERLAQLHLEDFDLVVVSLGDRADVSALVALFLKDLNVKELVVKAASEDHERLLRAIGVRTIVFPERDAAQRLAQQLHIGRIEAALRVASSRVVEEVVPPRALRGKTLAELDLRRRFGVQALLVRDPAAGGFEDAGPDTRLEEGRSLIVFGTPEAIRAFREHGREEEKD